MLKHREVVRWFLIIDFLIGLLFAGIFVFIPDLFLNFINWPISAADHRALFGYRILGAAIFGLSVASFLASFKDEWKEINVTMEMQCVWLLGAIVMMLWGHFSFSLPLEAWFIDVILIVLFFGFLILSLIAREKQP
jgi:hypothetical protein